MAKPRTVVEQRAEVTRLKGRLADIAEFEVAWDTYEDRLRKLVGLMAGQELCTTLPLAGLAFVPRAAKGPPAGVGAGPGEVCGHPLSARGVRALDEGEFPNGG